MASTLDMLDTVHGGGRDFLAEQIIAGASNAQMADALAAKFGIDPPTIRSVSHWANHDKALLTKVAKLRESGASPARAHLTVIAALEKRLEDADNLSTSELLEIEKAIRRQSGRAISAADSNEDSGGIPRAAMTAFYFNLADAGVFDALPDDPTGQEIIAAIPDDRWEELPDLIEVWGGSRVGPI